MTTPRLWAGTALLSVLLGLSACSPHASVPEASTPTPWVRTVAIESALGTPLVLSGTVRAGQEMPLAFQIGGRVMSRQVEAGQTVRAGQLLFALDPRDVAVSEQTAAAQLAAAQAALQTAERELERQRQLVAQGFVSSQTLDRLELNHRSAQSQLDAARASTRQTGNARGYTELRAPRDGVILDVSVETGQVVMAGQSLAMLALAGEREVEVFLPSPSQAQPSAQVQQANGAEQMATLREVAGAADPYSRTWRARYRLSSSSTDQAWPLGSVVRLTLTNANHALPADAQQVPLAALDERADGPLLWRVNQGRAEPVPITVLGINATHAQVRSPLAAGNAIIALGTHRLTPGMAVRELAR